MACFCVKVILFSIPIEFPKKKFFFFTFAPLLRVQGLSKDLLFAFVLTFNLVYYTKQCYLKFNYVRILQKHMLCVLNRSLNECFIASVPTAIVLMEKTKIHTTIPLDNILI